MLQKHRQELSGEKWKRRLLPAWQAIIAEACLIELSACIHEQILIRKATGSVAIRAGPLGMHRLAYLFVLIRLLLAGTVGQVDFLERFAGAQHDRDFITDGYPVVANL